MRHVAFATLVGLAVACTAACAAPIEEEEGDIEGSEEALTGSCAMSRRQILEAAPEGRREVIERSFTWLDANVPYNQSRFHGGYRTDCSGFVSMCWDLGRSHTTATFARGAGDAHILSSYDDLVPGDALVRRSGRRGHIVLFLGWNDRARTGACVIEQSSTRLDMEHGVRTVAQLRRLGYRALRADRFAE